MVSSTVFWFNHFTSHFWTSDYNKQIQHVARIRLLTCLWFCFLRLCSVVSWPWVWTGSYLFIFISDTRVVAGAISTWILSTFFPLLALLVFPNIHSLFLFIGTAIGLLLTTLVYIKIYFTVRRHKNQIQVQQVHNAAPTGEIANFASLINSAIGMFCVYLVFLICYLPNFICFATITIYGQSIVLNRFLLFSFSLVSLNSFLNPVIYCWKMRFNEHTIVNILRNTSQYRSRASHETLKLSGHTMLWFSVVVTALYRL